MEQLWNSLSSLLLALRSADNFRESLEWLTALGIDPMCPACSQLLLTDDNVICQEEGTTFHVECWASPAA